jgi:hypothetical protein
MPNTIIKWWKKDEFFQFIVSLNEDLDEVRGRIIGRTILHSPDEVFVDVIMEESHKSVIMRKAKACPNPPKTNDLIVDVDALRSSN